jgi:tRNA dimethylallyltransferase
MSQEHPHTRDPSLPASVIVITGPTASGKTDLAAGIARALDAEIVGADSRQVYRYMEAGTAKPSAELRAEISHHLLDVVDPDEEFDVARWRTLALEALRDIASRGRRAIVCGGTGLYVRSLTRGLFEGPAADAALRDRLEREERNAPGTLHARLSAVDLAAAERIHPNDKFRTIRALEVLELTGRPISEWHREHALADRPFATLTFGVQIDRNELARRIEERSRAIVAAGIVEELAVLLRRYPPDLTAFGAIGYREAAACLEGTLARADLADAIARATRSYAKRQGVWDRGQSEPLPVAAGDVRGAVEKAGQFFESVAKAQGIG